MWRKTDTAILRVSLVTLAGILFLAYVETRKYPRLFPSHGGGRWLRNVCPADPADRADFGAADYNWQLTALNGRTLTFAEFQDKVVFVNVWATWCGPCVQEMPAIQRLHDATSKSGVALVIVSEEDAATVRDFMAQEGYSFPAYLSPQSLPAVFESRGIPATFIVDRRGRVVLQHVGPGAWDSDSCQAFLRSLHQGGAPPPGGP